MASERFSRDLELLLRSRHAVILLETSELGRAEGLLLHLSERMALPFFTWTRSRGLRRSFEQHVARETLQPLAALEQVEALYQKAVFNFQGLGEDLSDANVAAKLADAAKQFRSHEGGVVVTGDIPAALPAALRPLTTRLELPLPSARELEDLLERLYRDLSRRAPIELSLTRQELARLARSLQGLTLLEAEKLLTKAMLEDNRLGPEDLRGLTEGKQRALAQDGLLEYYPAQSEPVMVAGMDNLGRWLAKRRAILNEPERARAFGLEFPKGVLLIGVQGGGKSLAAKAVAWDWGLPLIRMDPSGLYNKYIGETEKNFRRAAALAEKMAPVVLWIDEIEKAFSSGGEQDGGVSQRVLGAFLSWLQERKGDVFVVATANDVAKLPPELIRKGRFDEIFFVDLPTGAARGDIFRIHLKQRSRDPEAFELEALAQATEGFSGAEIEQIVVASLYSAFAEGGDISTQTLLDEARQTVPLSVTMREKLDALRRWAAGRTVGAA